MINFLLAFLVVLSVFFIGYQFGKASMLPLLTSIMEKWKETLDVSKQIYEEYTKAVELLKEVEKILEKNIDNKSKV